MTARPPFEPPATSDRVFSVTEITGGVRRLLSEHTVATWVRGEVVQFKAWASGHFYFTLRDARSQIRCVMWRQQAALVREPPADGTEVFAFGQPSLWDEKGEFRLTVTRLLPTAVAGAAQLELERVRAALERDGLFAAERKRRLPRFAGRIAVVTSVDGAALHDIVTVLGRRWPLAEVLVVGARVQGAGAVEELVAALGTVNRLEVDLCIVGRGGGGREDLAAFNAEAVCRALAAVTVPTISAVGHETDVSLSDLVADLRAPTPSAGAEAAVPDRREVERGMGELGGRLAAGLGGRVALAAERLKRYGDRLVGDVDALIEARGHALERAAVALEALSPLRVLARGYAVARDAAGRILRRRADFAAGARFDLRVADGTVGARVEEG